MHFAIADYILDIAHNAAESGAALVELDVEESADGVRVRVADDGRGMTEEELGRALDPFLNDGAKHARRKVGLGLPFLVQGLEQAGGEFRIESERGKGTRVAFRFPAAGPDVPPTGDLAGLFLALLCFPGAHEVRIRRRRTAPAAELDYGLSRRELAGVLGDLERGDSLALLRDYLRSQEGDDEE